MSKSLDRGVPCARNARVVVWLALVATPLACGWTVGQARGGIILDNLAPGGGATSGDKTFANIGRWAQQFTATESGGISDVKLNIYRTGNGTNGFDTFNVELWSGAGTTPTSQLVVLASGSWIGQTTLNSGTVNTSAYADFPQSSFTTNYTVTSGSTYWLVLSFAGNGPQAKRWATTGSGYQTASFNYNTSTWTAAGTTPSLGAQVSVMAVPEPATAFLALCGGAVIVWGLRRGCSPALSRAVTAAGASG